MFIITYISIFPSVCIWNLLWFEKEGASVSLTLTQFNCVLAGVLWKCDLLELWVNIVRHLLFCM
jgi:hypothetical protein